MATLFALKPEMLRFVPEQQPKLISNCNTTYSVSQSNEPLLRSHSYDESVQRTTNIAQLQIWKHYTAIYEHKRLEYLSSCNRCLPDEIWRIIVEYEYDTAGSLLMYVTFIYKQIHKLHFVPWIIGWIQLVINALVLSQIYKPLFAKSIHSQLLYCCGILMLIASSIQLIGALTPIYFIYDKNNKCNYNIYTLALLKGFMFFNNSTNYIFNPSGGWELFIEFEKWCNTIYVTDLLDKKISVKGKLFSSDIVWMYLCKSLYCNIYGIFLMMQTIQIVMWIWIPFIIALWYIALHTFLRLSSGYTLFICLAVGAMSYCAGVYFHKIIIDNVTFNTAIELTMFVNSGIVGGITLIAILCLKYKSIRGIKRYFTLNWIFVSAIFTLIYMCEMGINIAYDSKYQYTFWLCGFRLCGMYCWYISFNLGIFVSGHCDKYKNFDQKKFMLCCWLFGWFDLHCINRIFHKPYNR